LIVDDHTDGRETLSDLLDLYGFEVLCASDGQEALDVLHRGERPCLILVDLVMPKLDGWGFRQKQQERHDWSEIPVVAMTGRTSAVSTPHKVEFDGYLLKPINLPDLLEVLNEHCSIPAFS
jgi:CheY-like chemotaxis protein